MKFYLCGELGSRVWIPLLALAWSGCAKAPPFNPPDLATPPEWAAGGASGKVETGWLRSFHDRALEKWVARVMESNPNLDVRLARLDAAAAQTRIEGAPLWPEVGLGAEGGRTQNVLTADEFGLPGLFADGPVRPRSNRFGVSLDVSWEIDLWGRVRAGQSAAWADLQANWEEFRAFRLSLAGQTAKAWFAAVEAREQVALTEEIAKSFRTTADLVEARYRDGLTNAVDVRLARSTAASAESLVERRKQELGRALRQLELLAGDYPAATTRVANHLPTVPSTPAAGLPSELLYRRPDLLAAERRIASTDRRLREAQLALLPRISLTGSAGRTANSIEDLLSSQFSVWSLAGNLAQPLFQGGRLLAGIDQVRASTREALAAYIAEALEAFAEVENALDAETLLARQERFTKEAAKEAEAAYRQAESQYQNGLIDFVTVLEAQRRYLETASEIPALRRARLDNRVNLHLALGGDFESLPGRKTLAPHPTETAAGS